MGSFDYLTYNPAELAANPVLTGFDGRVAFDAYTATSRLIDRGQFLRSVMWSNDEIEEALPGHHRFKFRDVLKSHDGNSYASLYYGGDTHGDLVMLDVKGYRTEDAVESIRSLDKPHRCTRVDARADFEFPNAFETILNPMLQIKKARNIYGEKRGDWDFPDKGRTMYMGANSSAARARLYEKGKEPSSLWMNRPDLVRLEAQVRPQKGAKELFAKATPLQVFGAADWMRQLAAEVLLRHIMPLKAEALKPLSSLDRKLLSMSRQYSNSLSELFRNLGGDVTALGTVMNQYLARVEEEKRLKRSRGVRG